MSTTIPVQNHVTAALECLPREDHLHIGFARAGLARPAEQKLSRRRTGDLNLVGDVRDIGAALDVLDRWH